jgi:cell division protein FtsQ
MRAVRKAFMYFIILFLTGVALFLLRPAFILTQGVQRQLIVYDQSIFKIFESCVNWFVLVVNKIEVVGGTHATQKKVVAILNNEKGKSIFNIEKSLLVQKIQSLGWIENIIIRSSLPRTLKVVVQEQVPYALWQYGENLSVITESGDVIINAQPSKFKDLPLIIGEGANMEYAALKTALLEHPDVDALISSVQFLRSTRWRLHFNTGAIVDLPEEDLFNALHRLDELHRIYKVLYREAKVIDMRVENRLILRGGEKKTRNNLMQKNKV